MPTPWAEGRRLLVADERFPHRKHRGLDDFKTFGTTIRLYSLNPKEVEHRGWKVFKDFPRAKNASDWFLAPKQACDWLLGGSPIPGWVCTSMNVRPPWPILSYIRRGSKAIPHLSSLTKSQSGTNGNHPTLGNPVWQGRRWVQKVGGDRFWGAKVKNRQNKCKKKISGITNISGFCPIEISSDLLGYWLL